MKVTEPTSNQSEQLAQTLRNQIVEGRFMPGKQLPTFQSIESRFNVSRSVVQLAMNHLKRDGFIRSKSRQGLFVVPHPPHLNRYAIVFSVSRLHSGWSRFNEALVKEAERLARSNSKYDFEIFTGLEDASEGRAELDRLKREIRNRRLAGLIMSVEAQLQLDLPAVDPQLPAVRLFGMTGSTPVVSADGPGLIDRGMQWLKSRGRTRIAIVHLADTFSSLGPEVYARHGLEFRPQWRQMIGRSHPAVVSNLIPLLMDYPADQRPDGLIIADDNLVEHAASGVVSMGLRVGVDLDIVAHCNWPWPVPSAVPMQRIGYHAQQILEHCLKVIDARRAGETVPGKQDMPALFEDEAQLVSSSL